MRTLIWREATENAGQSDWVQLPVLLATTLIAIVAWIVALGAIDPAFALRDMARTAGVHPLTGVISNLGAFLLCATAAICAFASAATRRSGRSGDERFFRFAAWLTAFMWIDDFFMLHDYFIPRALSGTVPVPADLLVYFALGLAFAVFLINYRSVLPHTRYRLLVASIALLGGSVLVDLLTGRFDALLAGGRILLEDGLKWLGFVFWSLYFTDSALRRVARPA